MEIWLFTRLVKNSSKELAQQPVVVSRGDNEKAARSAADTADPGVDHGMCGKLSGNAAEKWKSFLDANKNNTYVATFDNNR